MINIRLFKSQFAKFTSLSERCPLFSITSLHILDVAIDSAMLSCTVTASVTSLPTDFRSGENE